MAAPHILLLAYHFPPEKSVGGDRPESLARHFRRLGARVTVVTASNFGAIPEERDVLRFEAIDGWWRLPLCPGKLASKIATKVMEPWRTNFDHYWNRNVLRQLLAWEPGRRPDLIHAVFPPIGGLDLALRLQRHWKIPLVTDFTDGLCFEPLEKLTPRQAAFRRRFEARVVASSAVVLSVAERLTEYLRGTFPAAPVHTVFNGYEDGDFAALPPRRPHPADGTVRVAHFGSINCSRPRSVAPLFDALKNLRNCGAAPAGRLEIVFYGDYTEAEKNAAAERGIADLVRFPGRVERRAGFLQIRQTCDALLLYGVPGDRSTVTSKLLEYVRLGLPVLGVCRGNEAEEILLRTGTGEVCGFSAEEIEKLFHRALEGRVDFAPIETEIRRFGRAGQAREILNLCEQAIRDADG